MSGPVITCQNVTKCFGKTEVLRGVDLEVPRGAIVGLVGTNGSGKSTLIKCLLGLLKVSSGTARILGEDSWDLSASVKNTLGYVPQEIKLYPWMRVSQVIDYTGAFYEKWDSYRCNELLEQWELDGSKWIKTLSGGQLQRLALVLALGHHPSLLILDEPAASLDPVGRRSFLKSLLEMNEDGGQSVLFSTHITSDLERVASHVAFLHDGRVQFFGELEELKDHVGGNLEDIFLQMNRTPEFAGLNHVSGDQSHV
ncbi:ABC transporter ATP-binding protein [Stieleria varia]|uniref:Putative ABC transporter ATP-binding protein YxlF n=1 Tax=Stieleria varia TaxID=2528005 RepID=A0A5C6B9K7_9BACT|nr:ABC transporter ATP-binding protein [Stieleria varia]TWU08322.1 putative ABC transporter ATP-binding protein YxlF [Stieleria varia]